MPASGESLAVSTVVALRTTDPWIASLDGRHLVADGSHWQIQVCGLLEEAGYRWVQLLVHGPGRYLVTLEFERSASPLPAFRMLAAWLARRPITHLSPLQITSTIQTSALHLIYLTIV